MKRLTPLYGSVLVLLAIVGGLLYPFAPTDDYVANAKEYYATYQPDGILYQKVEKYMRHPKGDDSDTTYTWETWNYKGNYLSQTTNIEGDLYEAVQDGNLVITDDFGNTYMYGDPSMYATNRQPVNEAPYCVQQLVYENEEWIVHSTEAFEASPNALEAFNTFSQEKHRYTFTHSGSTGDLIYIGGQNHRKKKTANEQPNEPSPELDLWAAIDTATTSPEQAKLLFDLLSEQNNYTHTVQNEDTEEERHVFRMPPQPYNIDENGVPTTSEMSIREFVFNGSYQLLEINDYRDETLMEQTKYLEEEVLPVSGKDRIFDPDSYGFKLFSFEHPHELISPSLDESFKEELLCYSFQNELLNEEETDTLATDYAPLIENIKTYWTKDLFFP